VHLLSGRGVYSGTETGVTVAFETEGGWTEDVSLLEEIGDPDGEQPSGVEAMFRLPGWPKRFRIAAGGDDAFGYGLIEMSLPSGQKVTVLAAPSESSQSLGYPASKHSPGYDFWVDGDETAAKRHVFDVPQDVDKRCFEVVQTEPASTSAPASDSSTSLPFDCEEGFLNWVDGWSERKKTFCCEHEGKGCRNSSSTPVPASTSTRAPDVEFDCQAGLSKWMNGWSASKKKFCCEQEGKGCADLTSTSVPASGGTVSLSFDCEEGFLNWMDGWSVRKKTFCCEHDGKGCQDSSSTSAPVSTSTQAPDVKFDCEAGLANWMDGWSASKQAFCCEHEGKGCQDFDCAVGYANWERGWSAKKKEYCCALEDVDCTTDASALGGPYNCSEGYANWEGAWTEEQQAWCCTAERKGCKLGLWQKYDCSAGDPDQVAEWDANKKFWCCSWETNGCQGGKRFDCAADLKDWISRWSREKIEWCCSNEGQGCAAVEETAPFDCGQDADSWDQTWSPRQQEWCCAREQKGCAGPAAFDCDLGRRKSEEWSEEKRTWCSREICAPDDQLVPASEGAWKLSSASTSADRRFGVAEVSTIVVSGLVLGGSLGAVAYTLARGRSLSPYSPAGSGDAPN